MDPTYNLCVIRDSFGPQLEITHVNNLSLAEQPRNLLPSIKTIRKLASSRTESVNVSKQLLNNLTSLLQVYDKYDEKDRLVIKSLVDPFHNIGKGQFENPGAIKLANIDAIYKLTGSRVNYFQPIDFRMDVESNMGARRIVFADLAGSPGGFTEYLQYRWPEAKGYGISLKIDKWNTKSLVMCSQNRGIMQIFNGSDNTGNLYTNAEYFSSQVLKRDNSGCQLVVADGVLDNNDELANSRLFLSEIYTALQILAVDGDLVIKMLDNVMTISEQLIYILLCSFNSISVMKPVTSSPLDAERYLICRGRREHIEQYLNILQNGYNKYNDDVYINQIFDPLSLIGDDLSNYKLYVDNLTKINNELLIKRIEYLNKAIQYNGLTNGDENDTVKIPRVDISKSLILWNLRDSGDSIIRFKYC